jgi:protein arginine kinase
MSGPLDEVARRAGEWLGTDGPQHEIVMSTRIRLARNIKGFLFLPRADAEMRKEIADAVASAAQRAPILRDLIHIDVDKLDELDRSLLVERHLISQQHADGSGDRRVAFQPGEGVAVMINEEDHLRMQVMRSGLQVEEVWRPDQRARRRSWNRSSITRSTRSTAT